MAGESVAALAAAGGLAIVQAAGTDTWAAVRRGVARLMGRGDPQREVYELERLDRTEQALLPAEGAAMDPSERSRWEGMWQARLEALLENCPPVEREELAVQLEDLVARAGASFGTAAEPGVAAGRDVSVRADRGSVAGAVVRVEGGLHWDLPFPDSPTEGSP